MTPKERQLAKDLERYLPGDQEKAAMIAQGLIEAGWGKVETIFDVVEVVKRMDMQSEMRSQGRSVWAECRHTIRYVKEDLAGLHTQLELVTPGWEAAMALELAGAIGRLNALLNYMIKKTPKFTEVSLPESSETAQT